MYGSRPDRYESDAKVSQSKGSKENISTLINKRYQPEQILNKNSEFEQF